MGVNGLTTLLRRYAPNSMRTVSASSLARQTIAFDASCHLNKFVYGDEPHEHRHVYGFYLLSRFCEHNLIKPIFVFDGSRRIAAKQLETERREKTRIKVGYSLDYERSRAERLEDWIQLSSAFRELSDSAAARILEQLGETIEALQQETTWATTAASNVATTASDTFKDEDEEAVVTMDTLRALRDQTIMNRERQLEAKLTHIAHELRSAVQLANDRAKYTRTVRDLSAREHSAVASMLRDRIENAERSLDDLKKINRRMLTSLEKRSIRVTQRLRDECQEFLSTLGYACVSCEGHEAEAMCAHLAEIGISSATVTEDMDTMVFGSAPILRYFFARNRSILKVDPVVALEELGLSRDEFIDMCILCGTDFSGTIQGIGPIRALQSIKQHRSIEKLLENLPPKYTPEPTFNYKLARKVFKSLPPVSIDPETYQPSPPDERKVAAMFERYDIEPEQVEERLHSILLQQNAAAFGWGSDPFAATVIPRL